MKAIVLLNVSAGTLAAEASARVARVEAAFARTMVQAEVRAVPPRQLPAAAQAAARSDADAVVFGGGDGTLNTGAQALVGSPKRFGVLPLGTLNHFARDLGVPTDLDEAVRTIESGHVRAVDVGDVNGRAFLNNCSIGLYPHVVRGREELRHRYGEGKWLAMLRAGAAVFRRFPVVEVALRVEDEEVALKTPFVFVGNNRYETGLFALGRRSRLDGGELGVYLSRNGGRLGLLRLAVLALLGRLEQDRDFTSFAVPDLEIDTRRRRRLVRVAVDGELTAIAPPIHLRSRPRALQVLAPPAAAARAAA
jgi:diacylglycerol kinase family enzyme